MSVTLENIDQIMARTNVSYKVAKETLEACNGNVVEAILKIEETTEAKQASDQQQREEQRKANYEAKKDQFTKKGKFLLKQISKLLQKGLAIKVTWSDADKKLVEIPLLVVILLAFLLMPISIIALVAPLFFGIRMKLTHENGQTTDVNDWIQTHTQSKHQDQ